ncbi:hypothetical protein [Pedobacter sp. B4-66]|uniref:hypothetical protein n=1 Tax=Pedobacter sp. B4-66 TaxID=2817280 RepID=UPI001BD9F7CE|nr:hypothetical protein [Pedobacter sp. B4-66]
MAIIKGRRFIVVDGPVDPGEGDAIEITVTFAAAPSSVSSAFPKMKFNKNKAILFEFDDDSPSVLTAYEKLKLSYYTDGCGNNKNFSCGLAINAKNNFNNAEWGDNYPGKTTYAERGALVPFGLDLMNHSYYHEPTGNFNNGSDIQKNFRDMDAFVLEKDNHYKMNALVVPTNYAGYQLEAQNFGYLFGASEGTFDGLTPYPAQFNAVGAIANIPKQAYTAIKRTFSDNWTNGGPQWTALTNLFASGSVDYFEIGSHGIGDGVNFNAWIDSIVSQANDTLLFQSMREFMEYKHLKEYVTKTEAINGNSVKITLDYSTVPNQNISWYDLSLLLTTDKAITNVSINRSDFALSYNATTKLINVKKRKTIWT